MSSTVPIPSTRLANRWKFGWRSVASHVHLCAWISKKIDLMRLYSLMHARSMMARGSIGVPWIEFSVRLIKICFHSMKWRVDVPSGITPFISFTPNRFRRVSFHTLPLSNLRMNSNIGFSASHSPKWKIDSLDELHALHLSE